MLIPSRFTGKACASCAFITEQGATSFKITVPAPTTASSAIIPPEYIDTTGKFVGRVEDVECRVKGKDYPCEWLRKPI